MDIPSDISLTTEVNGVTAMENWWQIVWLENLVQIQEINYE